MDLKQRYENVKSSIDKLKTKQIELQAEKKQVEKEFSDTIKEMEKLGQNPKTAKEDIPRMEQDIIKALEEKEKEVQDLQTLFDDIDKKLKELL